MCSWTGNLHNCASRPAAPLSIYALNIDQGSDLMDLLFIIIINSVSDALNRYIAVHFYLLTDVYFEYISEVIIVELFI